MGLYVQLLVDGLFLGGLYTLAAIGISLSYGVIRIINFAHGEFVMLGSYAAFWLATLYKLDPLTSLPLVVLGGGVAGYLLFRWVIRHVLEAPHLNQILLTFGISLVLQNLAVVLWTGDLRSATSVVSYAAAELGPVLLTFSRLIAFVVAVLLVVALLGWLKWSELGRATRAVAQNQQAALLMGIPIRFIYALSFGISAALGAAAGGLLSFLIPLSPWMGFPLVVKAFAIVALGGLGSVMGAIAGAMLLGLSETAVSYVLPGGSGWAEGVSFVFLLGILLLRPRGIYGQALEEQHR
ncbi:MAG: branched-chain amino acid ABC transporter permease [Candidatus Lambdaproteobacteria bacterium]|nr:branched-chain amino acid ABC transporter permease [Candidatus Lambdaproteobacteria bacterium]